MRTSQDEYIFVDGTIVSISQDKEPPKGAKIYNGYDYKKQYWVYKGKKDIRTIEELKKELKKYPLFYTPKNF